LCVWCVWLHVGQAKGLRREPRSRTLGEERNQAGPRAAPDRDQNSKQKTELRRELHGPTLDEERDQAGPRVAPAVTKIQKKKQSFAESHMAWLSAKSRTRRAHVQPQPRPKFKKNRASPRATWLDSRRRTDAGPHAVVPRPRPKLKKKQTFVESHMARLSAKNPSSPRAKLSPKIIFIDFI
jgi:hypothetical protein